MNDSVSIDIEKPTFYFFHQTLEFHVVCSEIQDNFPRENANWLRIFDNEMPYSKLF